MLRKAIGWILVTNAVRDARARLAAETRQKGVQLQQARLVAEVMKRVAEPAEALPDGNRAAIVLALGREAVASILSAPLADPPADPVATDGGSVVGDEPAGAEPPVPTGTTAARRPLSEGLDRAPPELLLAAAPDAPTLEAIKQDLPASPTAIALDASEREEQQAVRMRAFVEGLLWNADAPRRRLDQLLVFRLARLTLVAAALLLVGFGVFKLTRGPNLAAR